jgi:predicted nucleic acid-binding Zn finger protein
MAFPIPQNVLYFLCISHSASYVINLEFCTFSRILTQQVNVKEGVGTRNSGVAYVIQKDKI